MIPTSRLTRYSPVSFFLLVFVLAGSASASTIEGFVFDQARNPLFDVDVELQNENRQIRGRTRTNGIGRYQFGGLADGRYYIRVLPFKYGLRDDTRMVEINTISVRGAGIGNQTIQEDFTLEAKKGGLGDTTTGVVYAQEVPQEAEAHFKEAQKYFSDKKSDEGFKSLIKAVEKFPTYFNALSLLGKHLLVRKRYLEAAAMFVRAVEENPKSSNAFYMMGLAFSNLGKDYYKASLVAYGKAQVLAPAAHEIPLEMGKVQIELKDFVAAEASLLKAKKLADPKVAEIHMLLAKIYSEELKQYSKAADELETYIKVSKDKDEGLKAKVEEFRAKGNTQS